MGHMHAPGIRLQAHGHAFRSSLSPLAVAALTDR